MQSGGGYTFQARPRSVRAKYRAPEDQAAAAAAHNIMHDPRVVRGSTYAGRRQTAMQLKQQQLAQQREEEDRRRRGESRRSRAHSQQQQQRAGSSAAAAGRPETPEPVEGRAHMEVQTVSYLEELVDRPAEAEAETQTDPAKDRPVTPLFVPRPSGESKGTSVGEGDLFDFDLEVEPILEVLVGKVLDYGLMEVLEEEELRALEQHRADFEQKRNATVAVNQRLQAAEQRRNEEKERRAEQARRRVRIERREAREAAARTEAKALLGRVQETVIARLERAGHFYDPVVREVEEQFVPWLAEAVGGRVAQHGDARALVDDLVRSACALLESSRGAVLAARKERLAEMEAARVAAEEEARRAAEEEAERKRAEAERLAAEEAAAAAAEDAEGDEEGGGGDGDDDDDEE